MALTAAQLRTLMNQARTEILEREAEAAARRGESSVTVPFKLSNAQKTGVTALGLTWRETRDATVIEGWES